MPPIENTETKEIKINNMLFAYYEIEGKTLYLKVIVKINNDELLSEHVYLDMISRAENKKFNFITYLNI